jgi:hypothetical protein
MLHFCGLAFSLSPFFYHCVSPSFFGGSRLPARVDIAFYESNTVADTQTGEAGNEY